MDLIYRFDPFQPISVSRPSSAESAIEALLTGNLRLVSSIQRMQQATMDGKVDAEPTVVPIDLFSLGLPLFKGITPDQLPYALVLGCSDARVPIEWVFDQGFNDLFVVRIAGNVVGADCIGSFQYAVRHLGKSVQTVVVLGHTSCGAVTAAVDAYLSPSDYANIAFSHSLRLLVDRVMIVVRGMANAIKQHYGHEITTHPNYRAALIEATVYQNAAITAFDLKRELFANHVLPLNVVYGVCNVGTMLVTSLPETATTTEPGLKKAPERADEIGPLGEQIVQALAATEIF
ncbi:MAG: carbonic anhydrase [Pirellulales bacterium]